MSSLVRRGGRWIVAAAERMAKLAIPQTNMDITVPDSIPVKAHSLWSIHLKGLNHEVICGVQAPRVF